MIASIHMIGQIAVKSSARRWPPITVAGGHWFQDRLRSAPIVIQRSIGEQAPLYGRADA
jgi:hypothetical protein